MNLKTGIAALMLATAPIAGHAQQTVKAAAKNDSIVKVVKQTAHKADTVGFHQAQKMIGAAKKAPKGMVTVTREQGKFVGKVTPQGLNGDLTYRTSSHMIPDPTKNPIKVTYGANYVNAQNLPKGAAELNATVTKGKAVIKAETYLGKALNDVSGGLKLKTAYNYPLGAGFSVGPQANLHTNLSKIANDAKGAFAPEVKVGAQFKHEFNNGLKVGLEADGGAAARLRYNNRATSVGKMVGTYNAEASVGLKDVDLVVSAGKDVHMGENVKAGLRYNF